ncbi:hypothetical protein [Luteibacter sp. 9135]|uniref:hypothetical protein n=1 Tax=Luteibacter sp. 9135 TaxID=1500893 RepID=UPI00056CA994|nr:hypothetical protein [Luteibacter sp. 9135]
MKWNPDDLADLLNEAVVLHEALLANNFEEARYRARLITLSAIYGMTAVHQAANQLVDELGGSGSAPASTYVDAAERLSRVLDATLE